MIIETSQFKIYFGDSTDAISKSRDCVISDVPLIHHEKYSIIAQKMGVSHIALLNQTHSAQGVLVASVIPAFDSDGDFLLTAARGTGIGVLTADCLPIVLYDQKNHAAAVVHAGWRGSAQRICYETIVAMRTHFATDVSDLKIFFGPSAQKCCYQVAPDFPENLNMFAYFLKVFSYQPGGLYFDLPLFNVLQLQEIGVGLEAISLAHNLCTICDHRFFSYRRQAHASGRQITVVSLK
jgi:YfiH family protein